MKTTTLLLGMVGLMMSVGCGDSDDPSQNASPSELQCGSVELFAQTHDSCDGMDATGMAGDDGVQCRCLLGYKWNGTGCDEVSGCSCVGEDCRKLTETLEACEQNHGTCSETEVSFTCGSTDLYSGAHDVCTVMDAKAMPDEGGEDCRCFLGYAWTGEGCEALANCRCEGADCDKLTETQEACEQAHASCSSGKTTFACGSAELHAYVHDVCEAMDARAVPDENGSCYCSLGYAWNGSSCEFLADCACEGEDCDRLAQTIEQCEQEHAGCS